MPSLQAMDRDLLAKRKDVIDTLKSLVSPPLDHGLAELVMYGVGFHHAGLTSEERQILADAFDQGTLRVIVATCSLAAGINLPARRVVLQGARMGREMVGPAMLRQMRGRAGRKGKDEFGESYVCCRREELEEVQVLLRAELAPLRSSLTRERRGLARAVLESVAIRLATHKLAVQEFVDRTLLSQLVEPYVLDAMVADVIRELQDADLIQTETDCYEATPRGRATVVAGLSPEDSAFVHADLERAQSAFVMDGALHVFYIFTPLAASDTASIDWAVFAAELDALDAHGLRVMRACGINPGYVVQQSHAASTAISTNATELERARIHRRFFMALQLRDLCDEMPIHVVARKYNFSRGTVQTLWQACQGFAAATIRYCKAMDWGMLAAVLEHVNDRLDAGARADLLELATIPFVKGRTARVLWENGYRGIRNVAEADTNALAQVLVLAQPYRRKTMGADETGYVTKVRDRAGIIVAVASRLWERQQVMEVEGEL